MGNRLQEKVTVGRGGMNIDAILGFNFEGNMPSLDQSMRNEWMYQSQTAMEYDLKDGVIIGEERKKRSR